MLDLMSEMMGIGSEDHGGTFFEYSKKFGFVWHCISFCYFAFCSTDSTFVDRLISRLSTNFITVDVKVLKKNFIG